LRTDAGDSGTAIRRDILRELTGSPVAIAPRFDEIYVPRALIELASPAFGAISQSPVVGHKPPVNNIPKSFWGRKRH
jgi:hypothetical protein